MPDLPLFIVAAALLTIAPGPDNIMVLSRGIAQGRMAGLVAALGFTTGLIGHTALAVFGVAAIIRSSPLLFDVIRFAGAAYLCYLGFLTLRHRDTLLSGVPTASIALRKIYRQSVIANLLNPKVTLFFLSFLPQFVQPESGKVELQMLLLGGIFMFNTLLIFGTIAMASGALGDWLRNRAAAGNPVGWHLQTLAGITFIGLGVRLAMAQRGG
jgi:threonine/homoserine/homoserine lactone efflux protein